MPIADIDLAYAAALIDGEGSVQLDRRPAGHRASPEYRGRIQVYNTCLPVLEFMKSLFGGSIGKHTNGPMTRKQCYTWTVCGQGLKDCIAQILPYMKIKHVQATLLQKLFVMHLETFKRPRVALTEKQISAREALWQAMKALNS